MFYTQAQIDALMAEVAALDQAYERMDAETPSVGDEEQEENFDPIRDGWVGRDGRP
jgi:hypothetical protein